MRYVLAKMTIRCKCCARMRQLWRKEVIETISISPLATGSREILPSLGRDTRETTTIFTRVVDSHCPRCWTLFSVRVAHYKFRRGNRSSHGGTPCELMEPYTHPNEDTPARRPARNVTGQLKISLLAVTARVLRPRKRRLRCTVPRNAHAD